MADDWFDGLKRERATVLQPIRELVGWPRDEDYEDLTPDLLWRYIEALESALTAERRICRELHSAR